MFTQTIYRHWRWNDESVIMSLSLVRAKVGRRSNVMHLMKSVENCPPKVNASLRIYDLATPVTGKFMNELDRMANPQNHCWTFDASETWQQDCQHIVRIGYLHLSVMN